jgi:hypothetical protein
MSGSQAPGSAALAYPNRSVTVLACHWPAPTDLPQFCSCGALDCPTPARHPIGTLTPDHATGDLGQLSRWWQAHPSANVATYTDTTRLGVIELHHPARPDHVIRLLNTHRADPCPVISAGPGVHQFLVQPDPHAAEQLPPANPDTDHNGTVTWLAPGTLLLLPPCRLMSGERLRWMRRLHHTTRLPLAAPLLDQLLDFIDTCTLNDLHPLLA